MGWPSSQCQALWAATHGTDRGVNGLHPDGGGLARSSLFRFMSAETQEERKMGPGGLADVSLAKARKRAAEARTLKEHSRARLARSGVDMDGKD
jgi:hypothetical protein